MLPVPFGPFFAHISSKKSGRRKSKVCYRRPAERLKVRPSADLLFRHGERQRTVVSGVLHRPSAWTASRVGGRMTKIRIISELRRNLRNGALLHRRTLLVLRGRLALILLGQVHSAHLLCRAEINQEYASQCPRTVARKAAGRR